MTRVAIKSLVVSAACLWACGAAVAPVWAASSAASMASQSVSTSIGSLSNSLRDSSNSSNKPGQVAEGDYRIVDVAEVAERPDTLRLTLHALAQPAGAASADAAADDLYLFLPKQTVQQAALASGHVVAAHQRPYGVEFAQGQPGQAFFLLLADDWYRELQTQPVTL